MKVNGVEMPLSHQSGVLVLESRDGHQLWSLIVDATVEYSDTEFVGSDGAQMRVIATLPPGEQLRVASTIEAGEENVLVYTRLLVSVLRAERERYAELERELRRAHQERVEAIERRDDALADQDEKLWAAWTDGARNGYVTASAGFPVEVALRRNPHPDPEPEIDGCHNCGGPDH